jgi:hypothetical protein
MLQRSRTCVPVAGAFKYNLESLLSTDITKDRSAAEGLQRHALEGFHVEPSGAVSRL